MYTEQNYYYEIYNTSNDEEVGTYLLNELLYDIMDKSVFAQFIYQETACKCLACYAVMNRFSRGEDSPLKLVALYKVVREMGLFKNLSIRKIELQGEDALACSDNDPADEKQAFPSALPLIKKLRKLSLRGELPYTV